MCSIVKVGAWGKHEALSAGGPEWNSAEYYTRDKNSYPSHPPSFESQIQKHHYTILNTEQRSDGMKKESIRKVGKEGKKDTLST